MFKKTLLLLLILTTFSFFYEHPSLAYATEDDPRQVLVVLENVEYFGTIENLLKINAGRITHKFTPRIFIAISPASYLDSLRTTSGVALVATEALAPTALIGYDPEFSRWVAVWNSLIDPPPSQMDNTLQLDHAADHAMENEPTHSFVAPDLDPANSAEFSLAMASGITPGYYQTSEYLSGSVAVGLILVESNGSLDPSSEDWTEEEKQIVFNEVVAGLNWWVELEPRANLSFVYDDHFSNPLPTGVEPITRSYLDQKYWIADAMQGLGYISDSYFSQVRDYTNAIRTAHQTDWAFTIFVVDSSADADNRFKDGLFSYAYLGGPFMVMTSGNNGYGPHNMDAVLAHELGHIFHARDQYSGANQACTSRSGYLDVENQNSQYGEGCLLNNNSIMRGQTFPYVNKAIDIYAAGQVGWRDSDGDNILDPLDTALATTITSFSQNNDAITVSGSTQIIPFPSPTRNSVTINHLTQVRYRLNGGPWQNAQASDGQFDSPTESYQFMASGIPAGMYTLEVVGTDSANNVSEVMAVQSFNVFDKVDGGLNTDLYAPGLVLSGQAMSLSGVAYDMTGGTIAKAEYRLNGGPWQPVTLKDGAFDSNYEPFSLPLNTADLAPGSYLIEARATNAAGYVEVNIATIELAVSDQAAINLYLPLIVNHY